MGRVRDSLVYEAIQKAASRNVLFLRVCCAECKLREAQQKQKTVNLESHMCEQDVESSIV